MTEATLRAYLKGRFRGYSDDIGRHDDLSGVVDSLGLFELVEFLEQDTGLTVPTLEFRPDRFSSINNILALVDELRRTGAAVR
jgi:acyl carrier protein